MKRLRLSLTGDSGNRLMKNTVKRKMLAEQLEDRRLLAGPYAPAAGQAGSTAIANDDAAFIGWASGYQDYQPGSHVDVTFQQPMKALGPAEGTTSDAVTLGRNGQITLTFDSPLRDGFGSDFAVFENSFSDTFLELAYVEVSSDGVNFFRFDNDSLTSSPVGSFGAVDPTNVHNLAGKYRRGQGTPFDLEDLRDVSPLLNTAAVTHVRLIDVVGDGSALDSSGDVIYDPSPTEGSAGFDLDGIGVLNQIEFERDLVDFEDVGAGLDPQDYFNGPDPDGTIVTGPYDDVVVLGDFRSESLTFNNAYSVDFDSWNQWAYSNKTDTVTAGYLNQFSAYPGVGADGSATFGVAFASQGDFYDLPLITRDDDDLRSFGSLAVTNTTYAALSMLLGDSFAKKFGGDSGDDQDFFTLTIEGLDATGQPVGSVDVFLADYRFSDNTQDYILDDWITVDLGPVSSARSLSFSLSSSDVGVFGMNTPSYFAVDDIVMLTPVVALDIQDTSVHENDGDHATTARLTRIGGDSTEAIEFTIEPVDESQAILPTSVVIPAGVQHVDFPIGVVDNASADGNRDIVIRVQADGYAETERTLEIVDDDPLRLTLEFSANQIDEGGTVSGSVMRNDAVPHEALTVDLTASINGRLSFSSPVVIPAGELTASFEITAPEDDVDHLDVTVLINANAGGYEEGSDTLFVLDNDTPALGFSFTQSEFSEQEAKPTEGFELLGQRLAPESAYNGADSAGGFSAAGLSFNNEYNPSYGSWTGWAYSNTTDVTTRGYLNQYSSFTGGGAVESDTYLVGYAYSGFSVPTITRDPSQVGPFSSLDITNTTYAALSMREGDSFGAKKFGGASGDDPDFFILTIEGFDANGLSIGSVEFPLADFRFADQSLDYIVDVWSSVDVSSIGDATTLTFGLVSSDIGQYGMNTPGYFALDNIKFEDDEAQPQVTVTRNSINQTDDLLVQLYTSDHSEAVVQSNVVIPAGESSVGVVWEIIDDFVSDNARPVTFTAIANGYDFAQQTILIEDDDVSALTLTLASPSVDETAGSLTGVIHRNSGDIGFPLDVSVASDVSGQLAFPGSVTIPAGQRSVTFDISVLDNEYRDGDRSIQISSTAENQVASVASLLVVDDEISAVVVDVTDGDTVVAENMGTDVFSISLASRPKSDVSVDLELVDWPSGPADISIDQSRLVFTPFDWDMAKTVTLVGIPDLLVENNEAGNVSIRVDAANSDALYASAPDQALPVSVVEWRPGELRVSEDAQQVFFEESVSGIKLVKSNHDDGLTVTTNDLPQSVVIEPLPLTAGMVQVDLRGGADVLELIGDNFTRLDGGSGIDRLVVNTSTTLELLDYIEGRVFGFEEYVLQSNGNSRIEIDLDSIGEFVGSAESEELTVYVSSGEQIRMLGEFVYEAPELEADRFTQVIANDEGRLRVVSERPWQNAAIETDADLNGLVTVADALHILNHIGVFGSDVPESPVLADFRGGLPDVSGDNAVTAKDALFVLNKLALVDESEGEDGRFAIQAQAENPSLIVRGSTTQSSAILGPGSNPRKIASLSNSVDHAIRDLYSSTEAVEDVKDEAEAGDVWELLDSEWLRENHLRIF